MIDSISQYIYYIAVLLTVADIQVKRNQCEMIYCIFIDKMFSKKKMTKKYELMEMSLYLEM